MLNLKKLEKRLDEALEKETSESLIGWIEGKEKVDKMTDEYKTTVIFKKWQDGDVIALFPEEKFGEYISSYMHVGQHSEATPALLNDLENATPQEFFDLKSELESIGYNLEVL
jgi:hypothetical protein